MPSAIRHEEPLGIAVVGGGIVGLCLAAGLVRQKNARVRVFEQARNFREVGAGIGFTAKTIECMGKINPDIVTALRAAGAVNPSMDEEDPNSYFRWLDGYTQHEDDPSYQRTMYELDAGYEGWMTVRRDRFLEELVKIVPSDVVELQKRLATVEEHGRDDKIKLSFTDGTAAEADIVFGCDGIKSKVRQLLLGTDHPASTPQYTHRVAYRALVPLDKALDVLGEYKTKRLHFHIGPNAHIIHYPVNSQLMGATISVYDPNEWPRDKPWTGKTKRKEWDHVFDGWSKPTRDLVSLFADELEHWALFDLHEYPVPKYNFGRICLVGDSAHASSHHHGAGASMGIEDALVINTLLPEVAAAVKLQVMPRNDALRMAFETYNKVRRPRSQWMVNSSRRVCEFFQQPDWADSLKRYKAETCFEEIKDRSFKIWHFNPSKMVDETVQDFEKKLEDVRRAPGRKVLTNDLVKTDPQTSTTGIDNHTALVNIKHQVQTKSDAPMIGFRGPNHSTQPNGHVNGQAHTNGNSEPNERDSVHSQGHVVQDSKTFERIPLDAIDDRGHQVFGMSFRGDEMKSSDITDLINRFNLIF